jgi:hypothetical protein
LLCPVIFAYRQSLELRLKYLLMAYAPVADEEPDYRSHDLQKALDEVQARHLLLEGTDRSSEKQTLSWLYQPLIS